jgi:hypothetical protein
VQFGQCGRLSGKVTADLVVKTVYACANCRLPEGQHNGSEFVGENGLSGTVYAIDGNNDSILFKGEALARDVFQKLPSDRILFHGSELNCEGETRATNLPSFHTTSTLRGHSL